LIETRRTPVGARSSVMVVGMVASVGGDQPGRVNPVS
jgi:hypothetical protein